MTRHEREHVPRQPVRLMRSIYNDILPVVSRELAHWRQEAEQIPDEELRKQAIASMTDKRFHCQGGSIYALLAPPEKRNTVIRFVVAYQTISDYLDNLCDRSVSMDERNFRLLHQSMVDAISGTFTEDNYYALQQNQDDGGYLPQLVQACHETLQALQSTADYRAHMLWLCQVYCDLQVYKHISWDEREDRLGQWWSEYEDQFSQLEWYEFAAATGSTLGIFYYSALAADDAYDPEQDQRVFDAYFPYIQGLHILLDYLIDQEEDREEGDLNFCFYYKDDAHKQARFSYFVTKARQSAETLPNSAFHKMMVEGLLGMYLSQRKVKAQPDVRRISKALLPWKKVSTWFFYANTWYLHRRKRG